MKCSVLRNVLQLFVSNQKNVNKSVGEWERQRGAERGRKRYGQARGGKSERENITTHLSDWHKTDQLSVTGNAQSLGLWERKRRKFRQPVQSKQELDSHSETFFSHPV